MEGFVNKMSFTYFSCFIHFHLIRMFSTTFLRQFKEAEIDSGWSNQATSLWSNLLRKLSFSFSYLLWPLSDPAVTATASCFCTTSVTPEHIISLWKKKKKATERYSVVVLLHVISIRKFGLFFFPFWFCYSIHNFKGISG